MVSQGSCRAGSKSTQGEWAQAIETLQAVRNLGHDLHQQHFIDMCIGLSLFAQGELQMAAARWHSAMGNALQIRNLRGAAGSIEGCAYISGRRGQPAQAIRLLRAAEVARSRTQVPLFRFWLPFHEAAMADARDAAEPGEFTLLSAMSEAANQEDAANEALDSLGRFARS